MLKKATSPPLLLKFRIILSEKENKPIFLFFQEVPGCSTCRNYGHHVMSHPLIVETIETYFVPTAIFNNKKGEDAKVLKQYGEPFWNNPVVRIVNAKKVNIVNRLSGDYSQPGVTQTMIAALESYPFLSLKSVKIRVQSISSRHAKKALDRSPTLHTCRSRSCLFFLSILRQAT